MMRRRNRLKLCIQRHIFLRAQQNSRKKKTNRQNSSNWHRKLECLLPRTAKKSRFLAFVTRRDLRQKLPKTPVVVPYPSNRNRPRVCLLLQV